jgi:hypothetical protein
MPISHSRARILLAAALLVGPVPMLAAQETLSTPAPPAAPAAPQPGSRSVFTGDHTVAAGEKVEDVVVVGGDLRVLGTVAGDAVVVGGELILDDSGLIEGDATVTGGSIVENGGRVLGEMRMLDDAGSDVQVDAGDDGENVGELRTDRREMVRVMREEGRDHSHFFGRGSALRAVGEGFAGLISAIALGLVLAGIGALLIFYGRPYLDTVSDTIRASTLRSGAVGLAASFLVIPAFVVLVVALAVSIIGIPFLLVAVPLYPLAIAAAAGMGLLASAHAVGERTSEQRNTTFDFRYRNAYAYLFTGLGMLLAPLVAANLIEMTGFLGFIGVLLEIATWAVIWAATTVGLGAVILSRAGTRRTFIAQPQMDLGFDTDPGFEPGPAAGPHV